VFACNSLRNSNDDSVTPQNTVSIRVGAVGPFRAAPYHAVRRPSRVRPRLLMRLSGETVTGEFRLGAETVTLGRGVDATIPLESSSASRYHAAIRWKRGAHEICDAESRNGVVLNGLKVHAAVLHDGDLVRLGDDFFVYCES
jgi:FHA domain